jgi:DNA topoisomerase I
LQSLTDVTRKEITAKDFRTWAGTVLAAIALRGIEAFDSEARAKKNLRAATEDVAKQLGNTPAVCRKCYVHPEILDAYMGGTLIKNLTARSEKMLRENLSGLEPEEGAVFAFLRSRLRSTSRRRGGPAKLRQQLLASVKVFGEVGRWSRRSGITTKPLYL